MNERYTYGYNNGWNVENEYIESLKDIMVDYNNQTDKIKEIITAMQLMDADIIRTNRISEEQIREWYEADYATNNSLVSFEKYREDILASVKEKNQGLNLEAERNRDRYFANLKVLIEIKEEARKAINKRKNELELLLSEKNIELSSILLEQRKTRPEYDANGRIINSDKLNELREKYDACWLEIRKIEHALSVLKDMWQLVQFTKEETDLMMRGLNPQQKKIYDEIKKPQPVPQPKPDPTPDPTPIPDPDPVPTPDPTPIPDPDPVPTPEPLEEDDITLDGIIYKVCGEEKFNDSQSSRYAASKIKVFSKPQKNNLGLGYAVVSIPRIVIGVIPRAAMKVYGLFVSKKTKDIFKGMEERANNLTDQEVEVLLREYKGAVAQSKRLPRGFNDAVRPRVDKYISVRVAKINEKINEDLLKINRCTAVVNLLKSKLEEEKDPAMIARMNEVLTTAYKEGAACVKDLIALQIEGNNLQNGNGLHSFEEELKALDTKLNYVGGRFSKGREYDPELWSKISGYSQKIEYSLDPKEVLESYMAREQIYKENTKEKRSIFNLGSKVTAGKLDYRPFVESLNYGNDPYIRDLITSILVVSSAASLINNITNGIKQNAAIEEANARIAEHNRTIQEHQALTQHIRENGETIENGIVYDVRQTEGAIENMAERGINDKFGWDFGRNGYHAEDLAHHAETANLSMQNTGEILDLTTRYANGQITHAELLRGLQTLKDQTTQAYETGLGGLATYTEGYAAAHPQFDYTAVLSAIRHAASNPGASTELTDFIVGVYERSLAVTDLHSLDLIESSVTSTAFMPDILTLGATAAKVSQEEMDSKKGPKIDSKRASEIRGMIEDLKAMKAELTEEEIKELEELLRR